MHTLSWVTRWVIYKNNYWNEAVASSGQSQGSFYGTSEAAFGPGEKARGWVLGVGPGRLKGALLPHFPVCWNWPALIVWVVWPEIVGIAVTAVGYLLVRATGLRKQKGENWNSCSSTMWLCKFSLKPWNLSFASVKWEEEYVPNLIERWWSQISSAHEWEKAPQVTAEIPRTMFGPETTPFGIYPKAIKGYEHTHKRTHARLLSHTPKEKHLYISAEISFAFIISKTWMNPRCLSFGELITRHIHMR